MIEPNPQAPNRALAGITLFIIAFILFSIVDACAKWLVLKGIPSNEVVFARYAVHLTAAVIILLPKKNRAAWHSYALLHEIARAALLCLSTLFNFHAMRSLPLTVTATINFTLPLWVCLLSIPLLGEKVGIRRWLSIIVGFSGVLVITRPWGAQAQPTAAIFLSLGTVICISLYVVLTRKISNLDSAATQQLYIALFATLATAPLALTGDWIWPQSPTTWILFILIGLLAGSGHYLLSLSHQLTTASTLAPFVYTQIIPMTALSWIIFATPPDMGIIVGGGIIILSGGYLWWRERIHAQKIHPTTALAAPTANRSAQTTRNIH